MVPLQKRPREGGRYVGPSPKGLATACGAEILEILENHVLRRALLGAPPRREVRHAHRDLLNRQWSSDGASCLMHMSAVPRSRRELRASLRMSASGRDAGLRPRSSRRTFATCKAAARPARRHAARSNPVVVRPAPRRA